MLTIIFCWIAVSVAVISIGRLFLKNAEWYEYFWMGLVITFGILQIWSIFLPVNIYALVIIFVLGALSVFIFKKTKLPKFREIKNWVVKNKVFISIVCLTLIVISYYASQPVGWDDTLLYHLNAVKWTKLYSVVPGLANLHTRLGFNSSFFLFASMLDSWLIDRSSHLALSILAAVLSVEYLWLLIKSKDRSIKLFCLFTLPLMFYSIAYREIIASLSPDFAVIVLVLATAIEFLKKERSSVLLAILLSFILVTVKFNTISFATVIFFLGFLKSRSQWMWILGGGLLVMIPFIVRNIYLSGWLFYPLPYFNLNVDWAVPAEQVKEVYIIIQTWAKFPRTGWTDFIDASFWKWFPVWYQDNQGAIEVKMFASGSILLLISPFLNVFTKEFVRVNRNMFLLCFASFASILYVLFTAPDIRFGGIFAWVFFASVLSLYFGLFKWNLNVKILTILITAVFLFFISWPVRLDNEPILKSVRWEQAWPTENVNGILVPTKENFCGNSELPCSPETNKMKERVPGDISKGFMPIE